MKPENFVINLNKSLELNKDHLWHNMLKESMLDDYVEFGHYFKVTDTILGLFLSTKPMQSQKAIRLPFSCIFLDVMLPLGNKTITGLIISQYAINEDEEYWATCWEDFELDDIGISWNKLSKEKKLQYKEERRKECSINILLQIEHEDKGIAFDEVCLSWGSKERMIILDMLGGIINKKEKAFVKDFVINFCLFCNDPRVIFISKKLTYKDIFKRKKRNQPLAPYIMQTVVSEELRRYIVSSKPLFYEVIKNIKDFFINNKKYNLSYTFWVKGHYRKLRSQKFIRKCGEVIWVAPYKKGDGLEVNQEFKLHGNKRNRNINENKLK